MIILLMGVSGSGKTTIGEGLADSLGWPFFDADSFHPPANVEKMRQGIPLTDADRLPWLDAIRAKMDGLIARGESAVITASALKQRYRDRLGVDRPEVRLVYLKGDYEQIRQRMEDRQDHFMPPDLLRSQFETLEEPIGALALDITPPPERIVATIREGLGLGLKE